uniref:Katanin p80 WD40 repeat-containing subunit B1 n=1 Tax=Timema shepardi TaxID=629360 RepID=A0A7R9G395_TIMSH|nr:unnamed protein product [Timema shepardi]
MGSACKQAIPIERLQYVGEESDNIFGMRGSSSRKLIFVKKIKTIAPRYSRISSQDNPQEDFVAHGSNVNCLALGHKSGRVLVTGGDDKKVNLWAVGKHNCIMSLSGHITPVECVKFGHSEEHVCAGSQAGALKIWDLEAAKIVRTLTGHKASIRSIDFHPYGDFLTSGSLDTSIRLWDIRRKGCIFTYKGHKQTVNSLKFSPDGQWIASGGEEGIVKLWDLRAGRMLKEFPEHSGPVTAVEFHPNEFLLASSSADRSINFWDLENFHLVSSTEKDSGAIRQDLAIGSGSQASRVIVIIIIIIIEEHLQLFRCIYFSQGGECLFTGSQDILRVYGWEPARLYDIVPVGWGRIQDIATAQNQLIGASFHMTNVLLCVVDLKRVQPFGGVPLVSQTSPPSPFSHGQSIRKSFSRDKPFNVAKAKLDVKTIEESDRSGTDPEDDLHSVADIPNVKDYQEIFQPNRSLCRTPPPDPFPAPLDQDPTVPQILQPPQSEMDNIQESQNSRPYQEPVAVRPAPSPSPPQPVVHLEPLVVPSKAALASRSRQVTRQSGLCKEAPARAFPEPDSLPLKSSGIRHSPSEPALYRPNASHKRSHSLSRNNVDPATKSQTPAPVPTPSYGKPAADKSQIPASTLNPSYSRPTADKSQISAPLSTSTYGRPATDKSQTPAPTPTPLYSRPTADKPAVPSRVPTARTVTVTVPTSPVRQDYPIILSKDGDKDADDDEEFVPMASDRPTGLALEDFLPRSYNRTFGYQQTFPDMSEVEVLSSIMRGHESMMAVMSNRQRSLQIIYSLWHNKDLKAAVNSAVAMNDPSVVVDFLGIICLRPSVWNLDLCVALLPPIYDLIQSKYEM